ncbi:hypothetical protein JCM10213_009165, partial [Rhodosporidiobolus nylandii]
LHRLSEVERANPYFCLLDPFLFNVLVHLHNNFLTNPVAAHNLQAWIEQSIPVIGQLYQQNPGTPPLFHVQETLQRLNAQPLPPGGRHRVRWIQLQCLKNDPPGNVPPLHPQAPPGPTVDYAIERDDFLQQLFPGDITHYSESARVCVTPALEARSHRLRLSYTCAPTARLYVVMALIVSIELMSFEVMHQADIVDTRLYVLRLLVGLDTDVQLSYHPRIFMTSVHIVVRSLSLLRECIADKILSGTATPLDFLYYTRAVRLDIEVDHFATLVNELHLDVADLMGTFVTIGKYLEDFVARFGTGTHGGGGRNGPDRYRNVPGGGGRGCSVREKRSRLKKKDDAFATAPEYVVEAEWPCAEGEQEEMRRLLSRVGYTVEGLPDEHIVDVYRSSLSVIKLRCALDELDNQDLNDLLFDHPLAMSSETAPKLLELFDPPRPAADLVPPLTARLHELEAEVEELEASDGASPRTPSPPPPGPSAPLRDPPPAPQPRPSASVSPLRRFSPLAPGDAGQAAADHGATTLEKVAQEERLRMQQEVAGKIAQWRADEQEKDKAELDALERWDRRKRAGKSGDKDEEEEEEEVEAAQDGDESYAPSTSSPVATVLSPSLPPRPSDEVIAQSRSRLHPPPADVRFPSIQPERYTIHWPADEGGGEARNFRSTFVVEHVCRDSRDRTRPLTQETLTTFVADLVGVEALGDVIAVIPRTADVENHFADIQLVFKSEEQHQDFRSAYERGKAGNKRVWQDHNDFWVAKRKLER